MPTIVLSQSAALQRQASVSDLLSLSVRRDLRLTTWGALILFLPARVYIATRNRTIGENLRAVRRETLLTSLIQSGLFIKRHKTGPYCEPHQAWYIVDTQSIHQLRPVGLDSFDADIED